LHFRGEFHVKAFSVGQQIERAILVTRRNTAALMNGKIPMGDCKEVARAFGWVLVLVCIFACGCSPEGGGSPGGSGTKVTLLNVSYDPTRELYADFNSSFAAHWKATRGQEVEVDQSHGGSGKQARAVNEGLSADVVSLALSGDIDTIAKGSGLLAADWQKQFPHNSSPYTSTIVFLVRKGNPKQIRDWGDLIREDVEVITANPKTGGGARWNYLAAWGYAMHRELNGLERARDTSDPSVTKAREKAADFIKSLYRRVPVLDASARAATNTFLQRRIGDVLLAWENEAFLAIKELGTGEVEIVVPPMSILAEPPVAVVTKNAEAHGTLEVATAYLQHLYSDEGQRIIAKHYYRPRNIDAVDAADRNKFPALELFELTDVVADWQEAQEIHFKERTGIFDQVFQGPQ
jgi:sulfate transport system substrate-binding protein